MQVNFYCYDTNNAVTWSTNTGSDNTNIYRDHPNFITIQNDRNVVLYSWKWWKWNVWQYISIWESQTVGSVQNDDCFPGDATVEVYDKGLVAMKDLKYGDRVKTLSKEGSFHYEEVYFFGHRDASAISEYVNVQSVGGKVLQLSPKHFASLCVAHCTAGALNNGRAVMRHVYAKDVSPGDVVMIADGEAVTFAAVERIWRSMEVGLFNPYVRGGDIIVMGTVVSVHSEWVLDRLPFLKSEWLPDIYETLFFPLFVIYQAIGPAMSEHVISRVGLHEHRQTGMLSRHTGVEALLVMYLLLMLVPTSLLYCNKGFVDKKRVQA